ncbi:hypothetical protein NAI31_10550, partial [Francisella tularensis subsp. holarctica]|nr:hypothetical protein [Francisella tularensis subsp. holarctica]
WAFLVLCESVLMNEIHVMLTNIKIDTKKFILLQLILLLVGYFVILVFYNYDYANSFLICSLTIFLANFVFFFRLFINKQFSP